MAHAPPPDAPGRRFYSNLGFFLGAFTVPMGSNQTERSHYIEFIKRLDAAGALKPGAAEAVLAALRSSMSQHPYDWSSADGMRRCTTVDVFGSEVDILEEKRD